MAPIDRWKEQPWTAAELRALSAHLADAGEVAEEVADAQQELHERIDRLGELVDAIAGQLGRHRRPEPTPGEPVATTPRPWPDPDFEPEPRDEPRIQIHETLGGLSDHLAGMSAAEPRD